MFRGGKDKDTKKGDWEEAARKMEGDGESGVLGSR